MDERERCVPLQRSDCRSAGTPSCQAPLRARIKAGGGDGRAGGRQTQMVEDRPHRPGLREVGEHGATAAAGQVSTSSRKTRFSNSAHGMRDGSAGRWRFAIERSGPAGAVFSGRGGAEAPGGWQSLHWASDRDRAAERHEWAALASGYPAWGRFNCHPTLCDRYGLCSFLGEEEGPTKRCSPLKTTTRELPIEA